MDPLADKLLVCSAMICLIPSGRLPTAVVIVIIAREFIISGFRLVASDNGVVIAANYWGKFKTVSQMAMIIVLIADFGGVFDMVGTVLIWIATALTVISLVATGAFSSGAGSKVSVGISISSNVFISFSSSYLIFISRFLLKCPLSQSLLRKHGMQHGNIRRNIHGTFLKETV